MNSPTADLLSISIVITLISSILSRSEVCWDPFDMNYRNQCLNGRWEQRFYFDHASMTCRQFWFDGCRADSRNIFDDQLTCKWLCESQPMYKSRSCLEEFDEALKGECNGGRWRQQWYFDKNTKKCHPFWYDGCKGRTSNIFQDEATCLQTCENPAKKDGRQPWHNNDKFKMKEILGDVFKPNVTDVCHTNNPCKNNGTCIFVWQKNTHYCKCSPGFYGNQCEKQHEFDPCAEKPCLNGATCQMRSDAEEKPTYECFCTPGFGGPTCAERPCESNPCLNNGTCRTTKGYSTYFCECSPGFGGKNCDISVGPSPPEEKYGKNVERISSGKEEWIAQMRQRLKETGALDHKDDQKSASNSTAKPARGGKMEKKKNSKKEIANDEPYKETPKRDNRESKKEEVGDLAATNVLKKASSCNYQFIIDSLIILFLYHFYV